MGICVCVYMCVYICVCMCVCVCVCVRARAPIYVYTCVFDRPIGIMVRVFAIGQRDWCSIPGQVIPKTQRNGT